MSGHNARPQPPHGIPDGIVARLVKRIDELNELLDVQSAVIDGLAERIAALEARGPKPKGDGLGEDTRKVLAFLDSLAPLKLNPVVIAANTGMERTTVANSLQVLEARKAIRVYRPKGATATYSSKLDTPPPAAPTTGTEPKT